MPLHLDSAALSDLGRRRHDNQDRCLADPAGGLFAVADGLGGLPHGAEAAEATLAAWSQELRAQRPASLEAWRQLLHTINRTVTTLGRQLSPARGIGSTLTALSFGPSGATLAHVGDSAAFRLRDGDWLQLTPEHTVEARALRLRAAGLWEPIPDNAAHILTSCIGALPLEETEVAELEVHAGDRYLLCTDGITKPVPAPAIRDALVAAATPLAAAEELVRQAHRHGAPDNATAVVLFCRA
jgi:protein phosphatase